MKASKVLDAITNVVLRYKMMLKSMPAKRRKRRANAHKKR